MVLNKNEFGKLVKAYRNQRGWTQEELAERWGYTRAYVSQIEAGKKKLDSIAQVLRLADILDIPQQQLEAIGRGIPTRQIKAETPAQSDNALLQMLLAPGRDMVRVSWLAWYADASPFIEDHLQDLVTNLDNALTSYGGEFVKPAQQLLAYAHQIMGKMAFDRLNYAAAGGHFSEMIDLGQELNDPDIITLAMVLQGDLMRKRGRHSTALRTMEAAKPYAAVSSLSVQGIRHALTSRIHVWLGEADKAKAEIETAIDIAAHMKEGITAQANEFTLDDALHEKAGGLNMLWKPEQALEVYKEIDHLRSFRPIRDLGSYTITQAGTHLYAGDVEKGIELALKGLQLASMYQSKRHVARVERHYNRFRMTPMGEEQKLRDLRDALLEARNQQEGW